MVAQTTHCLSGRDCRKLEMASLEITVLVEPVPAGDDVAFLWEGNDVGKDRRMTYKEALDEVCRLVSPTASMHSSQNRHKRSTHVCDVQGGQPTAGSAQNEA